MKLVARFEGKNQKYPQGTPGINVIVHNVCVYLRDGQYAITASESNYVQNIVGGGVLSLPKKAAPPSEADWKNLDLFPEMIAGFLNKQQAEHAFANDIVRTPEDIPSGEINDHFNDLGDAPLKTAWDRIETKVKENILLGNDWNSRYLNKLFKP